MALEIDLNGHRYSIGKLSAKQQFHMSRRIAPIVPADPVFVRLAAGGKRISEDPGGMADVLQPLADGLAAMKDEDAEYVLDTACRRCSASRSTAGPTSGRPASVPMFQDIDLAVMLPLALRVITENPGLLFKGCLPARPAARGDTGWLKRLAVRTGCWRRSSRTLQVRVPQGRHAGPGRHRS